MDLMYIVIITIFLLYIGIVSYILSKWSFEKKLMPNQTMASIKISVIIPVRNEAHNISTLLQSFREINYNSENYEIIFIDDHSDDNTLQVLESYDIKNMRLLSLPSHLNGKKKGMEYGVLNASYNLIVCTDGDCIISQNWLSEIARDFELYHWDFCAMPVKYKKSRSCFDYFQTMDFLGMMGVSYVVNTNNIFTMANGANMAFTKTAFNEVGGFSNNRNQASGDDLFLIKEISKINPTKVKTLFNPDVLVSTTPATSYKEFLQQRFRWGSKNKQVGNYKMIVIMFVVWLASLLLLVQSIALIFFWSSLSFIIFLATLGGKFIIDYIYLSKLSKDFKIESSLFKFLCSFVYNTLYVTLITPLTFLFSSYSWKGRRY